MKKLHLLLILLNIISLTSCKTQEDIRREKTVESLNEQIAQTQKSTATSSQRFQSLEEQIAKMSGQLEENQHLRLQESKELKEIKLKFSAIEEEQRKQNEYIKSLNEKISDQSKYIEQVIKSLNNLSEDKEVPAKKKLAKKEKEIEHEGVDSSDEKVKEPATIKNAVSSYKEKKLEEAKEMFEEILTHKKVKKKDQEIAFHYLGMINYKSKKYEDAKVYFSKLYSEHQDSSYAPQALLNLARTFAQLKSKEEAKETLNELISRFPKTKEGIEGAKLKAKL